MHPSCNRSRPVTLPFVLIALFGGLAQWTPSQETAPTTAITSEQATARLRDYLEYPRRPLTVEHLTQTEIGCTGLTLPATDTHPAVVFGVTEGPDLDRHPAILISSGRQWWVVQTGLQFWYWMEVFTSHDRSKIWAVLEWGHGDQGDSVCVLHSSDGGWSWRTLVHLKKTWYLRWYHHMRMGPDGRGSLLVHLNEPHIGCPSPEDTDPVSSEAHKFCDGWDIYRTEDWGATWSEPTFVHGISADFDHRRSWRPQRLSDWDAFDHESFHESLLGDRGSSQDEELTVAPGFEMVPFDTAAYTKARRLFSTGCDADALEIGERNDPDGRVPHILLGADRYPEGPMRLIRLSFPGHAWRARTKERCDNRFWLILQQVDPHFQPERAVIVWGRYDIQKWTATELRGLPSGPYEFESVCFTDEGLCSLFVRGARESEKGVEPGLYIYETSDEGKTWSEPRFEPDILVPVRDTDSQTHDLLYELRDATWELRHRIDSGEAKELVPPANTPDAAEVASLLKWIGWRPPMARLKSELTYQQPEGETALHLFALHPATTPELMRAMVEAGAPLNARTKSGATALDYAACVGRDALATVLREFDIDVNGTSEEGRTSLHWLLEERVEHHDPLTGFTVEADTWKRRTAHAEFLLNHGADVDAKNNEGETPLHGTLWHNDRLEAMPLVELLVRHGADVNARDDDGRTPLHVAMRSDSPEGIHAFAKLLLSRGANADEGDTTPLMCIFDSSYDDTLLPVVKLLVKHGADVNARTSGGWTPLHALGGRWMPVQGEYGRWNMPERQDTFDFLLRQGADVHASTDEGRTPLHEVLGPKYTDRKLPCVRKLIEQGADVNAADSEGRTPLLLACASPHGSGHRKTVCYLLDQGAKANVRNAYGTNPLHAFIARHYTDDGLKAVKQLVEAGADVNAVRLGGATPLHHAVSAWAKAEGEATLGFLIQHGANVNAQDDAGRTPLHDVFDLTYDDERALHVVKALLEHDADPNMKDAEGRTPLLEAAGSQDLANVATHQAVRLLAEAGANVNVQDSRGRTPLMVALGAHLEEERLLRIQSLLEHGADTSLTNDAGKTALQVAEERALNACAGLLRAQTEKQGGTHNARESIAPAEADDKRQPERSEPPQ